jgi:cytochrome c peroxidase
MKKSALWTTTLAAIVLTGGLALIGQEPEKNRNAPDDPQSKFQETLKKMSAEKPAHMAAARAHLAERYDLSNRPAPGVTMTRGKAVQDGVRVKLPSGITWQQLAALTPDEVRRRNVWPLGFLPLPHVHHPEGGMLFPQVHIDEVKRQTDRDLARFDLDFETPDIFIPEFPPAIFLTTRPDLGDVSQGKLITSENFNHVLAGLLNPKQIEGLRLLVTPFPQQQFNGTEDRRSTRPSLGVTCFDCHVNGHTNAASHLVGDIRPQEFRHRIETPSVRGVNVQRLFGSQRALKSVEDFTEFEQRAAYFDGDPVMATKKGVNILERGSQVHFMSEMQAIFDFPPAPKLGVDGKLDPAKASPAEMRGQALFFGKAQCSSCHPAPYYTDNQMHDLQTGRFFEPRTIRNHTMVTDGKIKTFPLRGIKESPPYLHDGRLMTLDDTVEFFNLILGTKLTDQEKKDLVVFMRAL